MKLNWPVSIILILIFIFFLKPFEGTGDFYHHFNTGKYIIENSQLPNLDTYSHTAKGLPWVAHSWLSGLIFYLLLENFGELSITLLSSAVATTAFLLLYLLLRAYGASKIATLATLAIAAIPVSTRWPQRPEIFQYLLILSALLIDAKKAKYPKIVFLYPLLLLIWANLYGSGVLFGLGLLGLLVFKQLITDRFRIKSEHLPFYFLSIISCFLSLINGFGLKTIFYFYLYIPKVASYEGEWASLLGTLQKVPPGYLVTLQYYILIYFIYLVLVLLVAIFAWKILIKNWFPVTLGLFVLAPILAFRQIPLAAFLSAPILGLGLTFLITHRKRLLLTLVTIFAIIMLATSFFISTPGLFRQPNTSAQKLVQFIKNNNLSGNAFNMGHFGGFLTYSLYPQVLVFFDTRDDLYVDTKALEDLQITYSSNKGLIPLLEKYHVDLVIADFNTDGINYKDLFYSNDWAIVFLEDRYLVAVPESVAKAKNLNVLDSIDPFSTTGAKPGQETEANKFYEKLYAENPKSLNNKMVYSSSLLSLENYDRAIEIISSLEVNENTPLGPLMKRDKNYLLAESYLGKKDCNMTRSHLNEAEKATRPIFIFTPKRQPNSKNNKLWAFYYLICQKDQIQAQKHLDQFLSQPDVTPLEKVKVRRQFEVLISK